MDDDAGVVALAEDGIVSKWTRVASSTCDRLLDPNFTFFIGEK
jgi:hypothetical protein